MLGKGRDLGAVIVTLQWAGGVGLGMSVRLKAQGRCSGTGSMGKSLQKVICNGLFLSDKGMICSMSFAVLAEQLVHCSSCLVITALYLYVIMLHQWTLLRNF